MRRKGGNQFHGLGFRVLGLVFKCGRNNGNSLRHLEGLGRLDR